MRDEIMVLLTGTIILGSVAAALTQAMRANQKKYTTMPKNRHSEAEETFAVMHIHEPA